MTHTIVIRHSNQYPIRGNQYIMDSAADKEERKREYNRLAQREFRRRRKEHLKNLEQAQKEQSSEQSEEIERLRYENDELRRENEALRSQMYGSSGSSSHGLLSAPVNISSMTNDGRSYSLSPSISGTSISGAGSPPPSIGAEMMPMSALSLTSSMMPSSMQAYTDPSASQPYSMVHSSGIRHNSQSSPESSGYRSRSAVGSHFQPLNMPQSLEHSRDNSRLSSQPSNLILPFDRNKARAEINQIFKPLLSDRAITSNSDRHLALLKSLSNNLPDVLKPSKAQLETPHYWKIDMIASRTIRERLLTVSPDVAEAFIKEIGLTGTEQEDIGQLTIWGDDPLNEMAWEFSQPVLQRWGWLLGRVWVDRANLWRRQRGAVLLPEW
ncbi:hypothetical protein HYFRA_00010235 [Hymenoscyphus fraxineus]|uniref:BZIP domain-containing protein n=1 Tax=Hymenoscyphus fraxineus TaxID=746836 RepID=A0A9N9KSQ3_9HELO|nr:hypothetical protein HYFRA_00010235 [Hymenoscyphus fraxineus]